MVGFLRSKLLECELNTRQLIVANIVTQNRHPTVRDFSVIFRELKFYSVLVQNSNPLWYKRR